MNKFSGPDAAASISRDWKENPRWLNITRPYSAEDVVRLRGSVKIEHSIATLTANKLWQYLHQKPFVNSLGALTGNQAMQQVKAGLDAIYLSGWQVAGDANLSAQMYPDQSLYPADSVPSVAKRINNCLLRADQIYHAEGDSSIDWLKPIVADAEAGFGGVLNAFELMKQMIEAGVAGVHFEDQLSSAKKCGHMGGKVLVPTQEAIHKLVAARLAADVCGVPTILLARTDAEAANLITSDVDERDRPFITSDKRTAEGFFYVRNGLPQAIARGLAYAPYVDLLWCETGKPDLEEARTFAEAIHKQFPGKMLAYNCSPSFNWKRKLDDGTIARFQRELGRHGLQVPVHHAGRLPRPQLLDVRPGERLPRIADVGVCRAAGSGVQGGEARLLGHPASARSRRRLLRRRDPDHRRRNLIDHGPRRAARKRSNSTRRPTRAEDWSISAERCI